MNIELRHLRYFVAVAEELHFGRAAEACFVSQSTLSAGLRDLENLLDVVLVERTKRAVRAKFGETRMEKGIGWYAAMRSLQMRMLRMPKPQVRRGQRPE